MKEALLTAFLLAAVGGAYGQIQPGENQDPPCGVKDAELFIAIVGEFEEDKWKVLVTDTSDNSVIGSGEEDVYEDFPGSAYDGCNWVATFDPEDEGVVEIPANEVLIIDIEYQNSPVVTFQYAICTHTYPQDMAFYCGSGQHNYDSTDMHVQVSFSGDWEMTMFDHYTGYPILEDGGASLIYPFDWHLHCLDHWSSYVDDCDLVAPQIFVTTQVSSDTSYTHADRDLIIPSSAQWELDGDAPGGRVELAMPAGRTIQVDGTAEISNLDISHSSGTSFSAIAVASTGDLTLDADTIDAVTGIAVAAGGSLTMTGGSVVEFGADGELYSQGLLYIDDATLTKAGASAWDGITLSGSGADGSELVDMTFDHGDRVYVYNADNVLIDGSTISDATSEAILVQSSSNLTIDGSTLEDSDKGLSAGYSSVDVYGASTISGNTGDGLSAGYSSIYLVADGTTADNVITGNGDDGIDVTSAYVDMEDGHNLVYGNTDLEVWAGSGSTVDADGNWFGSCATNPEPSEIDESPWGELNWTWPSGCYAPKWSGHPTSDSFDHVDLILAGDTSPGAAGRLVRYLGFVRASEGRQASADVARTIVADPNHPHRSIAAAYRVGDLAHLGESALAVDFGERMLGSAEIEVDAKRQIARDLLSVYLDQVGSRSGAASMAEALDAYGLDDSERDVVEKLLARHGIERASGKRPFEEPVPVIASHAYPNPFRSTARIVFGVARDVSRVQVRVFDLLGRRVAELYDGELRAGEYTLGFDGSGLSAGQYIYRIEAGSQMSSGALFLLR